MNHSNRSKYYRILEDEETPSKLGNVVNWFLILLIIVNVIAVMLESVKELSASYSQIFKYIEIFSVIFFSIEYIVRLWICIEENPEESGASPLKYRIKYALRPMPVIDFLAIVPFYISAFFAVDLRFLRVLRLLRVLKLTRYFSSFALLVDVLRSEIRSFGAALMIMLILLAVAASGMYLVEHEAQEAFESIPSSLWWAIVTLTTVGYGDVVPITIAGRTIAALIMILGIGMVALPAGMLASRFSEELHVRRKDFSKQVEEFYDDGVLDLDEVEQLETLREKLGLSKEEALRIQQDRALAKHSIIHCPHCRKEIIVEEGKITDQ